MTQLLFQLLSWGVCPVDIDMEINTEITDQYTEFRLRSNPAHMCTCMNPRYWNRYPWGRSCESR